MMRDVTEVDCCDLCGVSFAGTGIMRWLCPVGVMSAALVAYLDWACGNYAMMAVAAFCAGVSTMLTWMQWRVFHL